MRFGLISLIALIGFSAAMPATASELAKKNKTASTQAKQVMGTILRGQQAHYLEESVFAKNLKDLGVNLKESTASYNYKIIPSSQPDKYLMVTAMPKQQGLPTYLGLVNVEEWKSGEFMTIATLCHSTQAKAISPSWSMIAKPKPQAGLVCPSGFKEVRN
jgi:hypothetical protein